MKKWLAKLIGRSDAPASPSPDSDARFQRGEVIGGFYEIYGLLGKGGFGLVLLVYDRQSKEVCALKTFRDEFLAAADSKESFRREASNWVDLGDHPFVLAARLVLEFPNRLFVKMDFVSPDREGRTNLADFLSDGPQRPISAAKMLEWAVQFCLGMEHANERGIKCHRDIKPQNILIRNGVVKIADFGLALAVEAVSVPGSKTCLSVDADVVLGGQQFSIISLKDRNLCGTPGYIPPEIFRGEPANVRSDIYSFGLVLWQMAATNPRPPFGDHPADELESYLKKVYDRQTTEIVPQIEGPIYALIEKCLSPDPGDRYSSFADLRTELAALLHSLTGKSVEVHFASDKSKEALQRGISLYSVGRFTESLAVLDAALATAPRGADLLVDFKAELLFRKGACFIALGKRVEAVAVFDEAIAADPNCAPAFFNKGIALDHLGETEKALVCYDRAIELRPNYFKAWDSKSRSLYLLGQLNPALDCCDRALGLNPKEAAAWVSKGAILAKQGKSDEALACYERCLAIDPHRTDALLNKAYQFSKKNRYEEAVAACDKCISIEPKNAAAWTEKGRNLFLLQRDQEAKGCYDEAIALDPKNPRIWFGKGHVEEALGNIQEAIRSFCAFIDLAGPAQQNEVSATRKKLRELEQRV